MSQRASLASATIANAASLSGAVRLSGTLTGIQMPASWTAANLTFQVSVDGDTYQNVYDSSGSEFVVTAAAARYIPLNPADFIDGRWLKVRSGTSGTPVNQGAERVVQLTVRHFE